MCGSYTDRTDEGGYTNPLPADWGWECNNQGLSPRIQGCMSQSRLADWCTLDLMLGFLFFHLGVGQSLKPFGFVVTV